MIAEKSIENMNFEEALMELEEIVRKIDAGTQSLDMAIKSFERGMQLKKFCDTKLEEARLRIEKITRMENGALATEPVEL